MKKTFLKQLFYVFAIIFSLTACDKDADLIGNSEIITANNLYEESQLSELDNQLVDYIREYNGEFIEANFIGRIINENNEPIEGARVTLGGQEKETDLKGIVYFTNAEVQQYFAHTRVFADGYLDGSRVMIPNLDENSQNSFTIKLFRFNEVGRINSEEGGEIIFETETGEGSVSFAPGFTDESGDDYNGDVTVSINYLDPLKSDTANTMPGDLYGITQDFEQVALGSYGMIEVALRGESGEKLQIIDPAHLVMPIHPDQIATAQSEVPMWSFNEHAGVWYEEAVAYRDGDHYVTEVPHFSFWNWDAPFPVTYFSATVIDAATSIPLQGMRFEIEYNGFIRSSFTSFGGYVSGRIPSNQTMILRIFDSCGDLVYSDPSFGPFASTTNIAIPVTINPLKVFTLSGTVFDCNQAPIASGYVTLTNSSTGRYITAIPVTAGTYSYTSINCSLPLDISIYAVDFTTVQASTTITTVNSGANTQDIVICSGLPDEYIRYSINGGPVQYDIASPLGGLTNNGNSIGISALNAARGTVILSRTVTLGTGYPFNIGANSMHLRTLGDIDGIDVLATQALANPMTFDLIAVGSIGNYISIDFAGNYVDTNGTTKTIQGQARIYRDY